jgi:PAS domain S-box-containing protein
LGIVTVDSLASLQLPDTERRNFMVLETSDQRESLYHPVRREILKALNQGLEGFVTDVKRTEKTLDDGTVITEEITTQRPTRRFWMSVQEILPLIKETNSKLEISVYNCYYHLRKLLEQGLVEQYPPPKDSDKGASKRVRGMYFRTSAKFFVPTTFEISTELAEQNVIPQEVNETAVELAQQVKETGIADVFEYSLKINGETYWFSVTMSLHDDGESIISVVRDITTQKQAQEALRKSQEKLGLALRGADLAPWDWHHSTKRMGYSEPYADMLGFTIKELDKFAAKWEPLIHPDDLQMVLDRWDSHLEGRTQSYSSEHRMLTKQGQYIWVLDRGRVVEWDEDGNPYRAAGTLLDVTHEKLVLEALDKSEERYRRLVNESLQGVAILVDGRIAFANPAYAETIGRSIGDLLEMNKDEVWNLIHPDDKSGLIERNQELDNGEKVLPRHRFRYVRPDGEIRWVDSYVNVVEYDGKPALQTLEVDITEQQEVLQALRESEKRFRGVFEVSPTGVILFDSQGRIIMLNESAKEILGVTKPEDYEKYQLENDPNIPEWVLKDIQEGKVIQFESLYVPKKAGIVSTRSDAFIMHVIGSALTVLEDGTATTFLVHIQDITGKQKTETTLRDREEKYRILLDNSRDAILVFKDLKVSECNNRVLDVFQCNVEQIKNKAFWQISPRQQADKMSSKQKVVEYFESLESRKFPWRFKRCDGSSFDAEVVLSFIKPADAKVTQAIARITPK